MNELVDTDRVMVINGDGRDLSLLNEEGIKNTQAFVALTGNAETNILACMTAKRLGVRKTVAMVENLDYVSMAESLDIGTIVNKKALAASYIYQMMLDADVNNIRFLMSANADVAEFTAQQGSKVTRKKCSNSVCPRTPPSVDWYGMTRDSWYRVIRRSRLATPWWCSATISTCRKLRNSSSNAELQDHL